MNTSPLAFGCAGLFREPAPRRRSEILHAALDLGITHFDVAPMYGMGLAETELGAFAKGRRDQLAITTKFGIVPSRAGALLGRVQRPMRQFMKVVPAARARGQTSAATPTAGSLGALLYQSVAFDPASARQSLERSLRALRTDYVDLLLLHDPRPGDVRSDEVRAYLEQAQTAGLIRAWGLSGDHNDVSASLRELSPVPVLQVRYPESSSLPASQAARVHFGVLNFAVETVRPALQRHAERQREWRDAAGSEGSTPEAIVSFVIQKALVDYPNSVVLFSSTQEAHIRAAAAAASGSVDPDVLLAFERLSAEILTPSGSSDSGTESRRAGVNRGTR